MNSLHIKIMRLAVHILIHSENSAIGTDLYITFDFVPVFHMIGILFREAAGRELVEILLDSIVLCESFRLVTEVDT